MIPHDSRVPSGVGGLDLRRCLCGLGWRFLCEDCGPDRPLVCGRNVSQFGIWKGDVSRNAERAGKSLGERSWNDCCPFLKSTDRGYPHRYVAPCRRAVSSTGRSTALLCRVARETSGKILIIAPSKSMSPRLPCSADNRFFGGVMMEAADNVPRPARILRFWT